LKEELQAEEEFLNGNTEIQKQLQTKIDGLTKTEEENNRTIQELLEKQKQLQATIDGLTKTGEENNRTIQELLEKQKQLQATIDDLTKTEEALNQTVKVLCGETKVVSICKLETVANRKWTENLPAINTV